MKQSIFFCLLTLLLWSNCTPNTTEVQANPESEKKEIQKPDNVSFSYDEISNEEEGDMFVIQVFLDVDGERHLIGEETAPGIDTDNLLPSDVHFDETIATASYWWAGGGANFFALWDEKTGSITVKREWQDEGMVEEDENAEPMIEDMKTIQL